jgi:hypothetical protein
MRGRSRIVIQWHIRLGYIFTKTREVDFHTSRVDVCPRVGENENLGWYGKG